MNKKCRLLSIFAISVMFIISQSEAKDSDFVKMTLDSVYQVEIPKSWKVHNETRNKALQSKTDSTLNSINIKQNDGQNRILLATNAYVGEKSVASARLSVRPSTKAFSQDVLKELTQKDILEIAPGMMAETERSLKAVSKDATVKFIKIDKQTINGKICISTESEQNVNNNIMRQIIDIYPLGDRTLKMAVSYSPSEKKYKTIVNKIRTSLIIK